MQREASFGAWVKQRRCMLELTQEDLARLINCSTAMIRKIESGLRRPSKEIATLLARHLDIAPHEYAAFIGFARGRSSLDALDPHKPAAKSRAAHIAWQAQQHATNLPLPLTPFIGRGHEVALLKQRITQSRTRLLTLSGPAGVGKTRLALEVASQVVEAFADGVFFVALDIISDPALVAQTILHTLQLVESPQESPTDQLFAYLHDKHTLLILDNFEHIVTAVSLITRLLAACPWLHVLVTSRVPLQARGEQHYGVYPLPLPEPEQSVPFERVMEYSGIALFVSRAQAVKGDWALRPDNAAAVIDLCRYLDGLPLAIELAAAHSCWLSPDHMVHQLRSNYPILRSKGFRDSSTRQQTLRDAIDWSYNLLNPATQQLFARLAVFCGGWTLHAVAAICEQAVAVGAATADHAPYVSCLLTLVDHNLVRQEAATADQARFTMLHTMHEYAHEQLNRSDELLMLRERHARYFRDLAEEMEPLLRGEQQLIALQAISREYANIHAALTWYQSAPDGLEDGMRLAGALGEFWFIRSDVVQGHAWLQSFLERDGQVAPAIRAKALRYAAVLASPQGDLALALRWNHASLELHRALGDQWGLTYSLAALGDILVWHNHDPERGQALFAQSLRLARTIDDPWLLARVTWRIGMHNYYSGRDVVAAQELLEESLAAASAINDRWGMSNAIAHVANIARAHGDRARAAALLHQGLALARTIGNQRSIATTLNIMGILAVEEGRYEQARAYHAESLAVAKSAHLSFQQAAAPYFLGRTALRQCLYREAYTWLVQSIRQHYALNAKITIALCFIALADVACRVHQIERAVHLLGSVAKLVASLQTTLVPDDQVEYERIIDATRSALDRSIWDRAWEQAQTTSLEQVIDDVNRWQL
ncbi:MAG TPA: helix-turn-helix domain-containing protein [Herpetosiphonaceae bacterium]